MQMRSGRVGADIRKGTLVGRISSLVLWFSSPLSRLIESVPESLTVKSTSVTRSIAAGSTQSLKGAPLRKAPGLRASTGT
jgi:hypothetical protein